MSLFELPCLLSTLLLGQTEPEPPAPEPSESAEEEPAPSALETLVSRLIVLVTAGFFALSWAYTHGCERL